MRYPRLRQVKRRRGVMNVFGGYEQAPRTRTGAFADMCNLTGERWPLLSVRPDRLLYVRGVQGAGGVTELNVAPDTPLTAAAAVNGTAVFCSGNNVYYHGNIVPNAPLSPDAPYRSIVPFGRNFFVAPDGKYVVTGPQGVLSVRHAAFSQALLGARIGFAQADGAETEVGPMRFTAPPSPEEGDLWTKLTGEEMLLMRYTGGQWEEVCPVYVLVAHAAASHYAVPGDRVFLGGEGLTEAEGRVLRVQSGSILLDCPKFLAEPTTYMLRLRKKMPVLDFAVEHGNRLWGCRFGENENGEFVNEIYASALGDPTVWDRFEGLSTDSYTASLGCPGAFTGAAVTCGELIFFKEDCIIRVTGDVPQDYTVQVTPARGVRRGCDGTCVTLNEKIFYLSPAGVAVFDGALPYVISQPFSTRNFTDTIAFAHGGRYYLAAAENGRRRIYVYDTAGLWHVEDDDLDARFFMTFDSAAYMLCRKSEDPPRYFFAAMDAREPGEARDLIGPGTDPALRCRFAPLPPKTWYAETGPLYADGGARVLRGLVFRLRLGGDALFSASLRCEDGPWRELCRVKRVSEGAFTVPVNTPRCGSFSLRFSGQGDCTLFSVTALTEPAGEVNRHV